MNNVVAMPRPGVSYARGRQVWIEGGERKWGGGVRLTINNVHACYLAHFSS